MCSSLLQLAPESHDLSQTEQIHKMTTSIFTQNDNFVYPGQFRAFFFLICSLSITVIIFSAWDKSRDPGAS